MSIGIAYGCLMAFASYNRFHNPLIRDALCLSVLNSLTSLIAGIIVFATLGHTALVYNVPIDEAATDGNDLFKSCVTFKLTLMHSWRRLSRTALYFGWCDSALQGYFSVEITIFLFVSFFAGLSLSLVMYSTVVSQMPFPQFWSVFLFVMFIFIGLDTQVFLYSSGVPFITFSNFKIWFSNSSPQWK